MKKRFVQRDVIDAQDDYNKLIKLIKLKHLLYNIIYIVSIPVLLAVFVLIGIKKGLSSVVFVPIFVAVYVSGFRFFKYNCELLKTLNTDCSKYDIFMNDRLKLHNITDFDIKNAMAVYKKYISNPESHFNEIAVLLNKELSNKPPNILSISVLCGLIFISDNDGCKDLLIKATTRGSASVLVFREWLLCCHNKSKYSSNELKGSFITYWNNFDITNIK